MKRALLAILLLASGAALGADNATLITPCASGCVTMRARDVGSGVQSMIQILGDTSGNAIYGTAGTANANILSVQGIASMTPLLATVTGSLTNISGTISLPTLASTSTKQSDGSQKSQIVDGSGNVIGATSNALDVNIKSGAGSGGTAIADGATFTEATTSFTPIGGEYVSGGGANCTTGKGCTLQMTIDRAAYTNSHKWAGGVIGAMANYGTSPGAVLAPGVNAFVTNSNANIGNNADAVAASATSVSPVGSFGFVWNGSTWDRMPGSTTGLAVKAANGAFASGAVVDITNMSVATGAAPPSKAIYLGANASGATGGLMAGIIQCDSTAVYDASTNGSTQLVALTSGRSVYVCGYTILAAGTVNVKLIYGTGTACATGSNNMTPAYQLTTQVGLVDGSPFYRGLKTASANELCINTSAGVAVQATVYYSVI